MPSGDEHMTDALNEQLSACLDGELPAAEFDLLLKRVGRERRAAGRHRALLADRRGHAQPEPGVASRYFADKVDGRWSTRRR